jgi:hypothetical protein
MKGYKENQEKGKQMFEQRKADMVSKALQDTKDKKVKNKSDSNNKESSSLPKIEDSLNETEQQLKDKYGSPGE